MILETINQNTLPYKQKRKKIDINRRYIDRRQIEIDDFGNNQSEYSSIQIEAKEDRQVEDFEF